MAFLSCTFRFAAAASLLFALASAPLADAPARIPGPFTCDALAFYIVHQGGPMGAALRVRAPGPTVGAGWGRQYRTSVLAHLYDAEQRRIGAEYVLFEDGGPMEKDIAFSLEDAPPGVYQLRYTTVGGRGMEFDLATQPPMPFGVQSRRARLPQAVDGQFSELFFYVPPGATTFQPELTDGSGKLFDERGNLLSEFDRRESPAVQVERSGVVWRMELALRTVSYRFFGQSGDFDAIFCPDEATALAIKGGYFAAGDGRLFPHRFQADMWDYLRQLRPEDVALVPRPDMLAHEDAFAAEPRNQWLVGPWGVFSRLPYVLANQTLDEPMSGRSTSLTLAAAYALDKPFNPFYRNEKILNRLLLSEFHRYLRLRQNDTLRAGMGQFVAHDCFTGDRTPFALAGALVEDEGLRQLWLESARRHVERYAFNRTSCENQSTHVPLNLYALYMGSGEELYRTLANDWMEATLDPDLNPPMRAGYLMEAYGPDATYQGLASNQLAWYFHWAGDERVKEGLRKIYTLFNHTVAPEPDGSVQGASNFSHRTPGSWAQRQYGGGTLSMSPYLEEAAAWHQGLDPQDPEYRQGRAESIREDLRSYWTGEPREPIRHASEYRFITRYQFFPESVIQGAMFPMVESDRFDRDFDGQFIAVRRPAYYALAYVGKPDPDVRRIREKDRREGTQRRTGGGLSMFWTPAFGNFVLSQNWHTHANQMPRADLRGGGVDYPDYYTVEHEFDEAAGTLTATSRMIQLPVQITRRMAFGDDALRMDVEFEFEEDVQVERLVEQIPFPRLDKVLLDDETVNIHSRVRGRWREDPPSGLVEAVRLVHKETGAAVAVAFPRAVPVRLGEGVEGATGRAGGQVSGRATGLIEIHLGNRFSQGQTLRLTYALVPMQ